MTLVSVVKHCLGSSPCFMIINFGGRSCKKKIQGSKVCIALMY